MRKFFLLSLALLASFSLCWADTTFKCKLNGSVVQERNDGNSGDFFSFSFSSGSYSWKGGSDVTGCTYDGVEYTSALKFDSKPTLSFTTTQSATIIVVQSTSKNSSKAPKLDGTEMTSKETIAGANVWTATSVAAGSHNVRYSSEIWIHCVYVIYSAPAVKYTVTYKAGDGTGDDVVDSDAKTVKAFADCSFTAPNGYEFKEWRDGSNVVAAGATVSSDMTLTANYRLIPTKYTVTYVLNGASGDAPTETDKAAGDVFNLAAAPERDGYRFDGWLCSADAAVKAAGASYTMTAANTTFTAQWTQMFTVTYYDGDSSLGTEQVANGGYPTQYAAKQTKALAEFVGWYNNADLANEHAIANIAEYTITANTAIYGKWNAAYAESVDFSSDTYVKSEKVTKSLATVISENNLNYSCGGTFSKSEWGTTGEDAQYQGYKFKDKSVYIEFLVAANKRVTLLFGAYGAIGTIKVGSADAVDCTLSDSKYVINTDAECVIRFTTNSGSGNTVTLKSITIADKPAQSDDVSLGSLTYQLGAAEPVFQGRA